MTEFLTKSFFELTRVTIGTQETLSRLPSETEWVKLFKMAEKQSLVGVCFVGLQNLGADADDGFAKIGMSEMLYLNWMGVASQISMKNELVNQQCDALQKRLSADGFRSCILKGQGVAMLYGEELRGFRQSGDIDIWVDASKENIIDYVMNQASTEEFDQKHIHFHLFDDTEVEVHWIPVKRNSPRLDRQLQKYFDSERERQFANRSNGLCVPTPDFQLVHQLLHVYSHYVYEGVGMRQLMDLYFAQIATYDGPNHNEDYKKILALFESLKLMRFIAATQWVLAEVFHLPEEKMLCSPDEKEGRKLLDEIMIGGNFGHHDARNQVDGESFVQRFFRRWGRRFRLFRFDPIGTLIMPFSRLKLEFWMRRMRRKYKC